MSILIKGMDMPKDGDYIFSFASDKNGNNTIVLITDSRTGKVIGHKGVIEIPTPHGRLVDTDDIKAKCINEVFESMGTVAITDPSFDDEWADDICDVPTILEAEE